MLTEKFKAARFALKLADIWEELIPNLDLDLDSKVRRQIHFWTNLVRKSQNCPFCLR